MEEQKMEDLAEVEMDDEELVAALSNMGGQVKETEFNNWKGKIDSLMEEKKPADEKTPKYWTFVDWNRAFEDDVEHLRNIAEFDKAESGKEPSSLEDVLRESLGGKQSKWYATFRESMLNFVLKESQEPGWKHGFSLLSSLAQKRHENNLSKMEGSPQYDALFMATLFDVVLESSFTLSPTSLDLPEAEAKTELFQQSYARWLISQLFSENSALLSAAKNLLAAPAPEDKSSLPDEPSTPGPEKSKRASKQSDDVSNGHGADRAPKSSAKKKKAAQEALEHFKQSANRKKKTNYPTTYLDWKDRIFDYLKPDVRFVWAKLPWEELYKHEPRHDRVRRGAPKPDQRDEILDIFPLAPAAREAMLRLSNELNNKNESMEDFDIDHFRAKQLKAFQAEFKIDAEKDKMLRAFFFYYLMTSTVTATTKTNTAEYYEYSTYAEFLLENLFQSETVLKGCSNRKKPSSRRKAYPLRKSFNGDDDSSQSGAQDGDSRMAEADEATALAGMSLNESPVDSPGAGGDDSVDLDAEHAGKSRSRASKRSRQTRSDRSSDRRDGKRKSEGMKGDTKRLKLEPYESILKSYTHKLEKTLEERLSKIMEEIASLTESANKYDFTVSEKPEAVQETDPDTFKSNIRHKKFDDKIIALEEQNHTLAQKMTFVLDKIDSLLHQQEK